MYLFRNLKFIINMQRLIILNRFFTSKFLNIFNQVGDLA